MNRADPNTWARRLALALVVTLLSLVIWSWISGGIVGILLDRAVPNAEKLEHVRHVFDGFGVYTSLVALPGAVVVGLFLCPIAGAVEKAMLSPW